MTGVWAALTTLIAVAFFALGRVTAPRKRPRYITTLPPRA